MQEEETHSLPNISQDSQTHSTPKAPEVVDFGWHNTADTAWSMRLLTDPSLVDPKAEMQLGQCEEEDATPEATFPGTDIWLPCEIGRNVCWSNSNTVLVSQTQYRPGWKEKEKLYHSDYTNKL